MTEWLLDDSGTQAEMLVSWVEMPRSPGHAFYDKLQGVLIAAGFDRFIETQCAVDYAPRLGRPSLPPGRYFRMLLIGYFEGIDSERGLEWRCADSLSLRDFLRLGERERVPDHSWLSRTRSRLSLEVHDQVFSWVLKRLAEHGLIKGERIGVDASTIEANAALRTIVRRDSGELEFRRTSYDVAPAVAKLREYDWGERVAQRLLNGRDP